MKASVLGFLAVSMLAADVRGDPKDSAMAQALFDDGMALMKQRAFAKACPKLAESQRLDPGIGTQFHLAECYEGQGLTASAWAQFLEVASVAGAAGQGDRQQAARKRAARLEPRLGRIRFTVPQARRVSGLHIERDGVGVRDASWDSPLPTDPGEHEVMVSAPSYKSFTTKVTVRDGQTVELEIPQLEAAPAASPPPAEASAPAAAPLAPPPPPPAAVSSPVVETRTSADAASTSSSGMGPGVVTVGALGIVGVGVGTVLGLMARSKFEDSKGHCATSNVDCCSAEGVKLREDSIALANGSTIAFIVGGVALATATVILIAKSGSKPAAGAIPSALSAGVQAGPSQGALVLRGSF